MYGRRKEVFLYGSGHARRRKVKEKKGGLYAVSGMAFPGWTRVEQDRKMLTIVL